jgi:hypothetical protein
MKTHLYWSMILVVALWQLELAVHSGIAASKAQPKPQVTQCETGKCPQPQPSTPTKKVK